MTVRNNHHVINMAKTAKAPVQKTDAAFVQSDGWTAVTCSGVRQVELVFSNLLLCNDLLLLFVFPVVHHDFDVVFCVAAFCTSGPP